MSAEDFMRVAIAEAQKGDYPYGSVLVKDHQVVAQGHNTVTQSCDPSAHAEINTIRSLTTQINNPSLKGYTLYTTCEPCPMCTGACIWTGISEIIYGASIQDLIAHQVSQIDLSCEEIIAKAPVSIRVIKGVLKDECLQLFQ